MSPTIRLASLRIAFLITATFVGVFGANAQTTGSKPSVGTIKFGWVRATASLAPFVSPQFSENHGLKIESVNMNTAVDLSTALISGDIDVGLLTPVHLLRAIDTKVDFVQLTGNVRRNTGMVISKKLSVAENDWDGLKRLIKTRKLKVATSRGSVNEFLGIAAFEKHGINIDKDIDLVNIANFAQHPQALRSGEFDMIITLEPLASIPVLEGFGTLFSHPYDTRAGDLNTVHVVTRTWLRKNQAKAAAFVATIVDAQNRLSTDKGYELEAATKLTGLPRPILESALKNTRYEVRNGLTEMHELARIAAERKYTTRNVGSELPKHVDSSFLRALNISD